MTGVARFRLYDKDWNVVAEFDGNGDTLNGPVTLPRGNYRLEYATGQSYDGPKNVCSGVKRVPNTGNGPAVEVVKWVCTGCREVFLFPDDDAGRNERRVVQYRHDYKLVQAPSDKGGNET